MVFSAALILLAGLFWCRAVRAQEPQAAPPGSVQPAAAAQSCVQPPPVVSWEDYQGPFKKVLGAFGRSVERESVRSPHYKPGAVLCVLELKDKLNLFVQSTVDPLTFLQAGFNAGVGQAQDRDPTFEQGAEGYGKRFGASYVDQASDNFFKDFAYPTLFREDPRYYRLATGTARQRLFYALGHVFVAYREDGKRMINASEWMGTASSVALSNLYHPGNRPGVAPAARRVGYRVAWDMGYDVLREFWPEIARKLRLAFRDRSSPQEAAPVSSAPPESGDQ